MNLLSKLASTHLSTTPTDDTARTYILHLNNTTSLPLRLTAFPVWQGSEYVLSSLRTDAPQQWSITAPQTIESNSNSNSESNQLATTRGPKATDLRNRFGWIFVDLVKDKTTRVHLQLFLHTNHNGIVNASMGLLDLASTKDNPMPSGECGTVKIEGHHITYTVDESATRMIALVKAIDLTLSQHNIGKSVELTSYVSHDLVRATVCAGNQGRYHEMSNEGGGEFKVSAHRLEGVTSRYIGMFIDCDDDAWFNGHVKVNPIDGIAKGTGFDNTASTKALYRDQDGNKITLNYGFHDGGEGRRDQLYVYITPTRESWLAELIAENPKWNDLPFSKLALAGAHDCGMIYSTLDPGLAMLIKSGNLGNELGNHDESYISSHIIKAIVSGLEDIHLSSGRVIANIAYTQKDSIADQLKTGIRFFDMRPGFCFADVIQGKKGTIHHQHAMVPGITYISFLIDILEFLGEHPSEIVFIELKSDGFVVKKDKEREGQIVVLSMIPSIEELAMCMNEARDQVRNELGRSIVIGQARDLDRTIGELIESNTRFIVVDKIHSEASYDRFDSYDHVAYNTMTPNTIIAMLEKTNVEAAAYASEGRETVGAVPKKGSIYQCQSTPTATISADVKASLTYSDSSSLLTYMKPIMDRMVYPFIDATDFTKDQGNVIFLTDFVDGVIVEKALTVSRKRAGW